MSLKVDPFKEPRYLCRTFRKKIYLLAVIPRKRGEDSAPLRRCAKVREEQGGQGQLLWLVLSIFENRREHS
eukprot:scaffold32547_cov18-Tisochrysis_lutea.AAC.1